MDPRIQSSFIPKKPLLDNGPVHYTGEVNVFLVVSTFLFVLALVAAGALFFLNTATRNQIETISQEISAVQAKLSVDEIDEFKDLSARLGLIEELLKKHTALSNILRLFEDYTSKNVRFLTFVLKTEEEKNISIGATGESNGFNPLAYQSETIKTDTKTFINPLFSDIELADKGVVKFSFNTNINPEVLLYANAFAPTSEGGESAPANNRPRPTTPNSGTGNSPAQPVTPSQPTNPVIPSVDPGTGDPIDPIDFSDPFLLENNQ